MSDFAFTDIGAELDGLGHVFDTTDFGELLVKNDVTARNDLGRFATEVGYAHERATRKAGIRGADFMRQVIPKGKTLKLLRSIRWVTTSSRRGEIQFGRGAPYWRYVAYGARPHPITGWVRFWWANKARPWSPGPNTISHPGIAPNPFIETTHHYTQLELEDAMREEYAHLR